MHESHIKLTEGAILTIENDDPSGDDRKWRKTQFARLHHTYHKSVAHKYNQLFRLKGRYEANTFLRKLVEEFTNLNRLLATNDDFLETFVNNRFKELAEAAAKQTSDKNKYQILKRQITELGLKAPVVNKNITLPGAIKRMLDHGWLTRQLRKTHLLHFENCAIKAGLVHYRASQYISDASLKCYLNKIKRNRRILENTELENEVGQTFDLADLVARSIANPVNRRNELMTRLAGFDKIARSVGHIGLFISLTCPSRMHARYRSSGDPVPSYDGTTPQVAQKYLTYIWARFRARIKHAGIHIYGFRVVEPQHDGTPHWHILIYCEPKYRIDVSSLIKELALEDSPDDKGADERRCDIKDIDWSIGSGVAYASKYVAKNVDGEHLKKDKDNRDPKESAIRAVAWASIHSIRQFQQFGGPSVTCWRELRKLGSAPEGILEEARTAADQADWKTFTQILGGTNTCRKSQKIKIVREFNEEPGKYGEPKGDQIVGISNGYTCIQTRMHTWKRKLKSKSLRVLDAVRHT